MDILGLHFHDPYWLLALPVPALIVAAAVRRERSAGSVVFPGASRAVHLRPTWRVRLRRLPIVSSALGLALLCVALARPQRGSTRENVTTQGIDIMLSLDVSGSMEAEDFQPRNRLEVAKEVMADFVRQRPHDRIGLAVFAGRSLTKCPPTTDTGILLRQLEDAKLEMLPDGTAIGSGLATALSRLRRSKARSRVVVLVTDGVNNAGEIDPTTASDIARAMEVRVYTVAVGRGGLVPMPIKVQDPLTGQILKKTVPMESDVDERLLKEIADRTGGAFFRAHDADMLRGIFDQIDRLEKSEIKQTSFRRYREVYAPFVVGGGALLLVAAAAWLAGLRTLPT